MKCSYIHSSLSKYKVFFLFPISDYMPHFMESIPLYNLPSFDLSPPLVDYVDDLLDACPIKGLLETLCVVVRLNITV